MNDRMKGEAPLAARMRPRNLDEYVGQEHILDPGKLLRRAIEADQLFSSISICYSSRARTLSPLSRLVGKFAPEGCRRSLKADRADPSRFHYSK
jgi:putative ATPase